MKHFSWLVALLLVCSTQMSYADCRSNDCSDPCLNDCSFCDFDFCDVTYDFYVDYLYWNVCRGGLTGLGENFVNPGYTSGWRVGGNFNYEDWFLGLRYTSFKVSNSRGDLDHKFDYKNLDIDIGYTIHFDCAPIDLTPFFGTKLVWVDEKLEFEDTNRMDFHAYGLRIGLGTRYNLCNWTFCDTSIPLAFVARASTGILHGNYDHNERSSECTYVPVHELYLGLDMKFCDLFCDTDANFQIGYEVQSFGYRGINTELNTDASFLGAGGLVARFGVAF